MILTVDDQMDAYWDVQAVTAIKEALEEERNHRCQPDMPPCPDCQARQEAEDDREYVNQ